MAVPIYSVPKYRTLWTMYLLMLVLPVVTGCHRGIYNPTSLPAEFQASPALSAKSIDLSRLAAPAYHGNLIAPGDLLSLTVATGIEEHEPPTWSLRVADDGRLTVPLVGTVPVSGLTLTDAEQSIRRASIDRGIYRNPTVSMTIRSRRTNQVTVVGAVEKPGDYKLPVAQSDLLSALVAASGLSETADTIVEIRHPAQSSPDGGVVQASAVEGFPPGSRGAENRTASLHPRGPWSEQVNLSELVDGNSSRALEDGAVVMVKKQEPRTIQVIGLVNKADRFELPPDQDVHLLDALAMAQGRTLQLADKVRVLRRVPDREEPVIINVSVRAAKQSSEANLRLAAGDVVSVEETPTTFLISTAKSFIRFGLSSSVPLF